MKLKGFAGVVCLLIGTSAHAFTCNAQSYQESFNDSTSGVHRSATKYLESAMVSWFKERGGAIASIDAFALKAEVTAKGMLQMDLYASATSATGKHYGFTLKPSAIDNGFYVTQAASYLNPKNFWCGASVVMITLTIVDEAGNQVDEYPADDVEYPESFNMVYPTDI